MPQPKVKVQLSPPHPKPIIREIPLGHPHKVAPPRTEGFVAAEDGQEMYCIPSFDRLAPFLMTLTSDSDLWMYVSSFGALTAGRCDETNCLFPYETEDRLHHAHGITGPITIVRLPSVEWEPFNHRAAPGPAQRNLYKSLLGDRIRFEEIRPDLGLSFRYEWMCSDQFGFIRRARLSNDGNAASLKTDLLDGLLNVMPPGVSLSLQQGSSCLTDAYKRIELDAETGVAIYSLASIIHDRPEPAECLKANIVWSRGDLPHRDVLLSEDHVETFRERGKLAPATSINGRRGAFLLTESITLAPGQSVEWDIVCDVARDPVAISRLRQTIRSEPHLRQRITQSIQQTRQNLRKNVASADALQCTADHMVTAHHAANVLFNNMRGGVPVDQYHLLADEFASFVQTRNKPVFARHERKLNSGGAMTRSTLLQFADKSGDPDLLRLAYEYLPLTFGRRHGDPSRPWNRFTIRAKNADGSPTVQYQGNWRDIFQNWEALAVSYPDLLESFIAKFVSASTIDGFNPYRITDEGIDWEQPNPADPWSNIGYWGDHQIVYLLKLLEASHRHHPDALRRMIGQSIFTYANVPFRIKPYEQIVRNPHTSIEFDQGLDREIAGRVVRIGADAKLLLASDDQPYHVNLAEKLLVPLLAKVCNLVVDGGIWMNTQRPEWNDANNALAGNGLSVVTMCYLRRYVKFLLELFEPLAGESIEISTEVSDWLDSTRRTLDSYADSRRDRRRQLLDELGAAFSAYRQRVYGSGFAGKTSRRVDEVINLLRLVFDYVDHSIRGNRREDGLYHAYNLLKLDGGEASIEHLDEMLEGQVAVLSSGCLTPAESLEILNALFKSRMYRSDQDSLMLYPDRAMPSFLKRNTISDDQHSRIPLLQSMLEAGDTSIVARDADGICRFNGVFVNAAGVRAAMNHHHSSADDVARLFEEVFDHHRFIGRSGVMYAYEGLGCIYWHMVCKLLLATQEQFWQADRNGDPWETTLQPLAEMYYRIRQGLGFAKSARQFGAFPTDPYSHTPAHSGARQPGMTGQVKEEILTRFGELGLLVKDGHIMFRPILLRRREFLPDAATWSFIDVGGDVIQIHLEAGSLGFSYCQVPIIYQLADAPMRIEVTSVAGVRSTTPGDSLDCSISAALFLRDATIARIDVIIPHSLLRLA